MIEEYDCLIVECYIYGICSVILCYLKMFVWEMFCWIEKWCSFVWDYKWGFYIYISCFVLFYLFGFLNYRKFEWL